MRKLEFSGTPREMGRAFGEATRAEVQALYAARIENAILQAQSYGGRTYDEAGVLNVADLCLPYAEAHHPAGWEEILGIAEGAGLAPRQVWAMNALTDLRDILAYSPRPAEEAEGCTSFVVAGDRTAAGEGLVGQTWDLATDNMPYVLLVERRPVSGPATLCLTLTGCLSLIGLNDAGISIGTTNIRSSDSRHGVGYLDVIHKVLAQTELDGALSAVTDARRAGAHYFYLMDRAGQAAALECSAATYARVDVETGHHVHCNHVLDGTQKALECQTPAGSSHHRQSRMDALIAEADGVSPERLQAFVADHDGAEESICRHDYNGISSNGSIIMEPATGRVWAVHGPACKGTWFEFSLPK